MAWRRVPGCPDYQCVNYIYPIKQKKVWELIEHTKSKYPNVKALAVFGSSVTERCRENSDIDIVVWKEEGTLFIPPDNDDYDIILPSQVNKECELWQEILKEGVVVYVRDSI